MLFDGWLNDVNRISWVKGDLDAAWAGINELDGAGEQA